MKAPFSFRSVAVRLVAFVVLAYIVYVSWHERFGRFMFFEEMDPPAADPHRTEHLRNAYYLIYGILGVILGFAASLRARLPEAIITIVIGIGVFISLRYRGIPEIFNPYSEEGYYGVRAMAVVSLIVIALTMSVRVVCGRSPDQTTKAEHDGDGTAPPAIS